MTRLLYSPLLMPALAAATVGLAVWHVQDMRLGRQLLELRTAHATAQARAAADAAQQRLDYDHQLSEALHEHQTRQDQLVADLAASRRAVDILRHTATTLRAELGQLPQPAAADAAAAATDLLLECAAAHQQLAAAADGHAQDVRLLRSAWPRSATQPATREAASP